MSIYRIVDMGNFSGGKFGRVPDPPEPPEDDDTIQIQRKQLTKNQRQWICDTHSCDNCPLAYVMETGETVCWTRVEQIENEFKEYWDKEIEVRV